LAPAQHRRRSVFPQWHHLCGFSPSVNRLWLAPHTRASHWFNPGHSPRRSLTRGVPLPAGRTSHDRAGSTSSSNRQRSWDFFNPSQFSFTRGSRCLTPACWDISPRAAFVRPPFIPTCRYPSCISPVDFYGCRPASLNSFQVRESRIDRQ